MNVEAGVDADLRRRFRKVFMNEASLVGKLIHPHIMAIYDADVADDYSYIVMEYVDGPTLEQYCERGQAVAGRAGCGGGVQVQPGTGVRPPPRA